MNEPHQPQTPEENSSLNIYNQPIFEEVVQELCVEFGNELESIIRERIGILKDLVNLPEPYEVSILRTAIQQVATLLVKYERTLQRNMPADMKLISEGNETELLRMVSNTASHSNFGSLKRITGSKELCLQLTKRIIEILAPYPLWYEYIVYLNKYQYFRLDGTLRNSVTHIVKNLDTYEEWFAKQNQPKPDTRFLGIEDDSPGLATQPTKPVGKVRDAGRYPEERSTDTRGEK